MVESQCKAKVISINSWAAAQHMTFFLIFLSETLSLNSITGSLLMQISTHQFSHYNTTQLLIMMDPPAARRHTLGSVRQ